MSEGSNDKHNEEADEDSPEHGATSQPHEHHVDTQVYCHSLVSQHSQRYPGFVMVKYSRAGSTTQAFISGVVVSWGSQNNPENKTIIETKPLLKHMNSNSLLLCHQFYC